VFFLSAAQKMSLMHCCRSKDKGAQVRGQNDLDNGEENCINLPCPWILDIGSQEDTVSLKGLEKKGELLDFSYKETEKTKTVKQLKSFIVIQCLIII